MRNKKRIPIVLKNIVWEEFLTDLQIFKTEDDINKTVDHIKINIDTLTEYWNENPDQRLTQVLVNTGMIPNFPGVWYYIEEDEYMIEKGWCKFGDINFWGAYGKSGKEPLKSILINEMEIDHIKACLKDYKDGKMKIDSQYLKAMEERLVNK